MSSDNTVEIIKSYQNLFTENGLVLKWVSEKDTGIYDAWNKGIQLAEGEWISFLGSDDEYLNEALTVYHEALSKNPAINYISSKIDLIDQNNKKIRTLGIPFDSVAMTKKMSIAQVGSFHHKSLFEKIGFFSTKYRIAGDYEFYLRGRNHIKAGFIDAITAKMREGGASSNLVYKTLKEGADIKITLKVASKYSAFSELVLSYTKCYIKKIFRL